MALRRLGIVVEGLRLTWVSFLMSLEFVGYRCARDGYAAYLSTFGSRRVSTRSGFLYCPDMCMTHLHATIASPMQFVGLDNKITKTERRSMSALS